MRGGHHKVARAYVLYREEHARRGRSTTPPRAAGPRRRTVTDADGERRPLDWARVERLIAEACAGLDRRRRRAGAGGDPPQPVRRHHRRRAGARADHGRPCAGRDRAELFARRGPAAARHAADRGADVPSGRYPPTGAATTRWPALPGYFRHYVHRGIELELLDPSSPSFDLDRLGAALRAGARPGRSPSSACRRSTTATSCTSAACASSCRRRSSCGSRWAWRCARTTARRGRSSSTSCSPRSTSCASTPTLFNAGTTRPQLSSCFLTTVDDDLDGIFQAIRDNALLAKYSGGLGNDWTPVRGIGAHIKGTNGQSPGRRAVPEDRQRHRGRGQPGRQAQGRRLRVPRDLAHRRRGVPRPAQEHRRRPPPHPRHEHRELGARRVPAPGRGRRRSGRCSRPTRSRTCTTSYGDGVRRGATRSTRRPPTAARSGCSAGCGRSSCGARMLTTLFETGHPWITFKDPCNLRSPQQHAGVVHSSNLCTEITLNTSAGRTRSRSATWARSTWPRTSRRTGSTSSGCARTVDDRGADARQRDRRQLLHDPGGAAVEPAAPPGRAGADGLPGRAVHAAACRYASRRGGRVRRRSRWRRSPTTRSRRRPTWPPSAARYASFDGSLWSRGHPADRLGAAAAPSARDGDARPGPPATLDWDALRAAGHARTACATRT